MSMPMLFTIHPVCVQTLSVSLLGDCEGSQVAFSRALPLAVQEPLFLEFTPSPSNTPHQDLTDGECLPPVQKAAPLPRDRTSPRVQLILDQSWNSAGNTAWLSSLS